MLLKQSDPKLKIYIAVGGWAFNDPGPTATTFSDLAASVPRQKIFMESLLSFMATYGLTALTWIGMFHQVFPCALIDYAIGSTQ
jgi:chitinase